MVSACTSDASRGVARVEDEKTLAGDVGPRLLDVGAGVGPVGPLSVPRRECRLWRRRPVERGPVARRCCRSGHHPPARRRNRSHGAAH